MNKISIAPEDEYSHKHRPDPYWWENYHFNGYDATERVGFTTYTGIKPFLGVREEIATIYSGNPLFYRNEQVLGGNPLTSGSLKMEPVELLRKWRIFVNDSFSRTENGISLANKENVEFNLYFEADMPPYGFRTERGDRYEQPGSLRGEIRINNRMMNFEGKGIRDHSWEIRHIPSWGEWYALMGYLNPGFVSSAFITAGGKVYCQGWVGREIYDNIQNVRVEPEFSNDVLKECHIEIETVKKTLTIDSRLVSFVNIVMGEDQGERTVRETLVTLKGGGYGFLWYGK